MAVNKPNPYSLNRLWSSDTLDAYRSMPLHGGYVVALDYLAPKDLPAFEGLWREWCRVHPRSLWPTWLEGWPERKAMRQ